MPVQFETDDDVVLLAPEEETVPESDLHRILVDLFAAGVVASFHGRDDVAVFSRLAWFPDREDTRIRLDPDVMVVFGRHPGHRKSYQAWREGGVAPAVLIEVQSEDDTDTDYRRRLERARRYGVEEVVVVNPTAPGAARVEHLVVDADDERRFRTAAVSVDAAHPVTVTSLGITVAGGDEITVNDAYGRWPTTAEAFILARSATDAFRQARVERARADQAERREQAASTRAARAERRAQLLAERLRAAGIDDSTV